MLKIKAFTFFICKNFKNKGIINIYSKRLYEEVNKLSNLYNIIQTNNIIDKTQVLKQNEYKVSVDNIKDFFDNYNLLEEDEIITKAQTLYNEYIKSVNSVSFSTIYYCIATITLLFILIILVKKKES